MESKGEKVLPNFYFKKFKYSWHAIFSFRHTTWFHMGFFFQIFYFWLSFLFRLKKINICYKVDLVVLWFHLLFFLSGTLFTSPSVLNDLSRSILGCKILPFSTLKMSCHSLLSCSFVADKLLGFSFIWLVVFLLLVSVFKFCHFNYNM